MKIRCSKEKKIVIKRIFSISIFLFKRIIKCRKMKGRRNMIKKKRRDQNSSAPNK